MDEKSATLTDLLFKDSAKNKSYVVTRMRRGVKQAALSYTVVGECVCEEAPLSLVHIVLETGRTHQIRVQFSARRHPLVGDRKYGGISTLPLGLLSYRLTFQNTRGKTLTVTALRENEAPFSFFGDFTL